MKTIRIIAVVLTTLLIANIQVFAEGDKTDVATGKSIIKGIVIDKATQEKLAGVSINVEGADKKIYTDADGSFTIEGLASGEYTIDVTCISYWKKSMKLHVNAGQSEQLSVSLESID